MTAQIERSVVHATFALERDYPAPVPRVFAHWAEPGFKARWFAGSESQHSLDFREGGRETAGGHNDRGTPLRFETLYREIVPDLRIVYTSALYEDDVLATASLTTVEFSATEERGTRLTLTEQGAYLDGREDPSWREMGTTAQLDALGKELATRLC